VNQGDLGITDVSGSQTLPWRTQHFTVSTASLAQVDEGGPQERAHYTFVTTSL
jgi:hypothetical protein